jgi:D-ribulokinase
MNRTVCKMKNVSGAAGAAVVAASSSFYSSLQEAATVMVHAEKNVEPELRLVDVYEEKYHSFLEELKRREVL